MASEACHSKNQAGYSVGLYYLSFEKSLVQCSFDQAPRNTYLVRLPASRYPPKNRFGIHPCDIAPSECNLSPTGLLHSPLHQERLRGCKSSNLQKPRKHRESYPGQFHRQFRARCIGEFHDGHQERYNPPRYTILDPLNLPD